jgi:hypothetical protein
MADDSELVEADEDDDDIDDTVGILWMPWPARAGNCSELATRSAFSTS